MHRTSESHDHNPALHLLIFYTVEKCQHHLFVVTELLFATCLFKLSWCLHEGVHSPLSLVVHLVISLSKVPSCQFIFQVRPNTCVYTRYGRTSVVRSVAHIVRSGLANTVNMYVYTLSHYTNKCVQVHTLSLAFLGRAARIHFPFATHPMAKCRRGNSPREKPTSKTDLHPVVFCVDVVYCFCKPQL